MTGSSSASCQVRDCSRGVSLLDQTHEAGSFGHEPAPLIAADDVLHEQRPRGRSDVRGARLDEGGRQLRRAYVLVSQPVLYVFGRMRVREIVPVGGDQVLLEEYLARCGAWRFLAPTCTTEVVIGFEGTGVLLDQPLPGEILRRLTYSPRRGPRPVRHVSQEGRLLHSLSVQGI
jgi:hypothetical protein